MHITLPLPGTDHHLDAAINHLRSLNRRAFLTYAIEVGDYLVHHFFEGDYDATHDQRGDKHHSFIALLEHRADDLAELDLSGRTLRNYMAAAEVWQGLPESTRSHLGLRHLQQLAALPDVAERKRLAHDAAIMKWTTKQVSVAVNQAKNEKRGGKKRPGRKPKPAALKAAVAMQAGVRRLVKLRAATSKLDGDDLLAFRAEVEKAVAALKDLLA